MPQPLRPLPVSSPIRLNDIYYALFRRKWLILTLWVLGAAAAAGLYLKLPKLYRSEAKLLVRYVREAKAVDALDEKAQVMSPDRGGQNLLNSELEILSSLDLARDVAEVVGPTNLLAGAHGGTNSHAAASALIKGLRIQVPPRSNIIKVTFDHPDPQVAQNTLRALVEAYLKKHVEIHRALGVIDSFLAQQVDQARAKLIQAEEELRKVRLQIGSLSVDEARAANAAQLAKIRQDILDTEAQLAELGVVATNRSGAPSAAPSFVTNGVAATTTNAETPVAAAPAAATNAVPPQEKIDQHKLVSTELTSLRAKELELSLRFTDESLQLRQVRQQIASLEQLKKQIETEWPAVIPLKAPAADPARPQTAPGLEALRANALLAKLQVLNSQWERLRAEAAKIDEVSSQMRTLQRNRDSAEANYRHLAESLEQARFDQALDPGKTANISKVQEPSPAWPTSTGRTKIAAGVLVAGLFGGLALALFLELVLNQSVSKPGDVEAQLHLPLCLAIPDLGRNGRFRPPKRPAPAASGESGSAASQAVAPWAPGRPLRDYCDTLRDQLILDFHARNLTHKPKLVGVTGCTRAAGVTTLAAGLAQSLSETGGGSVLLVELKPQQGIGLSHFLHGKPGFTLAEMLDGSALKAAAEQKGLYLVVAPDASLGHSVSVPQKLAELVPKLKLSDVDYVVFDMPPVGWASATAKLAGMLDTTLLVLEAEKTPRAAAARAKTLLEQSEAHVMTILNRHRSYMPEWLEQRLLPG